MSERHETTEDLVQYRLIAKVEALQAHVEALEGALAKVAGVYHESYGPEGPEDWRKRIARAALAGESETPTTCPTCGSDERGTKRFPCGAPVLTDPWHTVPTTCPRCGSDDFRVFEGACEWTNGNRKAHPWHTVPTGTDT